jgi:Mrp family chromosome partitioning ATPase
MKPSAAEALKAAIRRAIPITLVLILVGVAAVNAIRQWQGPQHEATARVFHPTGDIGAILADAQPAFVDPRRVIETALSLARAPEVYERTAAKLDDGRSGGELRAATTVAGDEDSDVIGFTSTASSSEAAVATVNAAADEYVAWRGEIAASAIRRAIDQVEGELRTTASPTDRRFLRDRLNRLRVLDTLTSGGAVVIERAESAPRVSPNPVRDSLLGAAFGFLVALLVSGGREAFNTRVRSEADVEDALNRPVLASIQTLPKRSTLVTVGRHESRYGDTYALLAANVMQLHKGKRPLVLAVTSAIASEGKTTTASNLAVAMANRGQRVVLLDFDLRKPSVDRLFRIPKDSPGVIQLIDGATEMEQATWAVPLNGAVSSSRPVVPLTEFLSQSGNGAHPGNGVSRDEMGGERLGTLRVIPAGGSERGARVARSTRVADLLEEFSTDADVIILDTPPALVTVEMAELSRNVDMVLVVVRHGRVTRRSLLALNRQAEGWQSEIAGAVLTGAPSEEDDYYYYSSRR